MYNRLLLQKVFSGPYYVYCDIQDVVLRIAVVDGEVEVYVKYRDKREFKTVYDSRLVGLALSREPVAITKEQYENFRSKEDIGFPGMLNYVCLLCYPAFEPYILSLT